MTAQKMRLGIGVSDDRRIQQVKDDEGQVHWLRGVLKAKGAKPGDRVKLEYMVSFGSGLWYATKSEEPITIMQVFEHRTGKNSGSYTLGEFDDAGLPMFGGCQVCQESLAAYNAYPSKTGFLRCRACVGDKGFKSVQEFEDFEKSVSTRR